MSRCHAVDPGDKDSREPDVTSVQTVADMPGMSALVLWAELQASHSTTPNIVLEPDEFRNVTADSTSPED